LVNQLIEAGQLTEAEAETFEHNNIILQALGTADNVQVDLTYVVLRRGDTLLLCSDGLSGMVRFDEIREVLLRVSDPLEACRLLTDRANAAGGHDNITVIVAQFDGEALAPPMPGDDELRYRKYALPEVPHVVESTDPPPRSRGPSERPIPHTPIVTIDGNDRLSDHGPSRSKVAHTIMGAQMSQAALSAIAAAQAARPPSAAPVAAQSPDLARDHADPIFIPTSLAPAWMVGGVVLTALALAMVAGYYLLR
ncbi:MAG TPA: hypothetical protein VGL13_12685, partial [Polyangiaceae bacterium]